jgi:hypothetical protein
VDEIESEIILPSVGTPIPAGFLSGIPTWCMVILLLQNWTGLLAPQLNPPSHSFPRNPHPRNQIPPFLVILCSTLPPNPLHPQFNSPSSRHDPVTPQRLPSVSPLPYLSMKPPSRSPRLISLHSQNHCPPLAVYHGCRPNYHVTPWLISLYGLNSPCFSY